MNEDKLDPGRMSDVDVSAFDPIFYLHHWYLPCPDVRFDLISKQQYRSTTRHLAKAQPNAVVQQTAER